jgi:hypothetical protein
MSRIDTMIKTCSQALARQATRRRFIKSAGGFIFTSLALGATTHSAKAGVCPNYNLKRCKCRKTVACPGGRDYYAYFCRTQWCDSCPNSEGCYEEGEEKPYCTDKPPRVC